MTALYQLFPATIHPMVVHFTIAINFLATFVGLTGLFMKKDLFYEKAFFGLLILSVLATLAAGVTGTISEYYANVPTTISPMLETHQHYGVLTGLALVAATTSQWLSRRSKKRISAIALGFSIIATILVSITGHFGGSMVYDHGLGVHIP